MPPVIIHNSFSEAFIFMTSFYIMTGNSFHDEWFSACRKNKYQIDLRAVRSSIYIGFFSSTSWVRVVSNVIRPSQIISPQPFLYQKCFVPVSQQQILLFFSPPFYGITSSNLYNTPLQLPSLRTLKALFQCGEHYGVAVSTNQVEKISSSVCDFYQS